jgi:hypothetical protein
VTTALLLLAALTTGAPDVATDTVVQLQRGDRVVVTGLSGSVSIEAVPGSELGVTTGRRTDRVAVRRTGGRVLVTAEGRDGGRRPIDVSLRVPSWADIQVDGNDLDVSVRGGEGTVSVGTVDGDLLIEGTAGEVRATTIEGEIVARATRGPVVLSSHADDITVLGPRGPVEAGTLDGDIRVVDAVSASVRAETQSGDIDFAGAILSGGTYRFYLHSGDALLALPAELSARVRVSTFHGDFESDFPVVVTGFTSGRAFDFTVGGGDAEIVVEAFDGEIRLTRGDRR